MLFCYKKILEAKHVLWSCLLSNLIIIEAEEVYSDPHLLNNNSHNNWIFHLNKRVLNTNSDKLDLWVRRFKVRPYILVFSETRFLDDYQLFILPGYNILYSNNDNNICDGVVIFIKKCKNNNFTTLKLLWLITSQQQQNSSQQLEAQ